MELEFAIVACESGKLNRGHRVGRRKRQHCRHQSTATLITCCLCDLMSVTVLNPLARYKWIHLVLSSRFVFPPTLLPALFWVQLQLDPTTSPSLTPTDAASFKLPLLKFASAPRNDYSFTSASSWRYSRSYLCWRELSRG